MIKNEILRMGKKLIGIGRKRFYITMIKEISRLLGEKKAITLFRRYFN